MSPKATSSKFLSESSDTEICSLNSLKWKVCLTMSQRRLNLSRFTKIAEDCGSKDGHGDRDYHGQDAQNLSSSFGRHYCVIEQPGKIVPRLVPDGSDGAGHDGCLVIVGS